MQIIIPMSGVGQRFLDAGYKIPKPLIMVDGKTIIGHVLDLFDGEKNFIFICNSLHLKETKLKETLDYLAPSGKVVDIAPHKKGPVYAVSKIFDMIDDDEEVIVNYCDFSKYWDYEDFLRDTRQRKADGAISAYRGFHPHMLGLNNYAFIRDENRWMVEIREKQPFTDNRMQEYASDGTYYFKKGSYVKKYFKQLIDEKISVNGEYYVSMVYNLMKNDNLKVSIYEIEHMLQWGTPKDLEEYQGWSDYFEYIVKPFKNIIPQKKSINLIPLAGKGSRFLKEGYKNPKPLIDINGKPMIIQAASYLPSSERYIFICLKEHMDNFPLEGEIKKVYPKSKILGIDKITEGQACTCEIGLRGEDLESPLLISACDNGTLWDIDKYEKLINDKNVDVIVWSFTHNLSAERHPEMYGWIKVDNKKNVLSVSVKKQISVNPYHDQAIAGTFYFKKCQYFMDALKRLRGKDIRVNGEFYVDSCINELIDMGMSVKVFEVNNYISWGTPNDLRTYEYWQSFFHKSRLHPYCLEKDVTINRAKIAELGIKYRQFSQ